MFAQIFGFEVLGDFGKSLCLHGFKASAMGFEVDPTMSGVI